MIKIGSIYTSKEGLEYTILEKDGNWYIIYNKSLGLMNRVAGLRIKQGTASLYIKRGGYFTYENLEEFKKATKTRAYRCWIGIFARIGKGNYKDVTIHEDWLCFNNFLKFYDRWFREGFVLDKDLLSNGKKIYSEDTCCFIPAVLNCAIRECSVIKKDIKYPIIFMNFHTSRETLYCKDSEEKEKLFNLYRVVKIRTLVSLYDTQIRKEAVERIYKLYNTKDYGKNTDSSTL